MLISWFYLIPGIILIFLVGWFLGYIRAEKEAELPISFWKKRSQRVEELLSESRDMLDQVDTEAFGEGYAEGYVEGWEAKEQDEAERY